MESRKKVGEGSYGKVYRCVRDEYGINSVCARKITYSNGKTEETPYYKKWIALYSEAYSE